MMAVDLYRFVFFIDVVVAVGADAAALYLFLLLWRTDDTCRLHETETSVVLPTTLLPAHNGLHDVSATVVCDGSNRAVDTTR